MAPSATCSRCGEDDETLIHCIRDYRFSRNIWNKIGFSDGDFFSAQNAHVWINSATSGPRGSLFLAGLWWVWRYRNLMCLNNEFWSLFRITNNIHNSAEAIRTTFQKDVRIAHPKRLLNGIVTITWVPFSTLMAAA